VVHRFEVPATPGLHRASWDLRLDDAGARAAGPGNREQPGGGRGAIRRGPPVAPGRYRATLGRQGGAAVEPVGEPQAFSVVRLG
jgi:hypothetical protein